MLRRKGAEKCAESWGNKLFRHKLIEDQPMCWSQRNRGTQAWQEKQWFGVIRNETTHKHESMQQPFQMCFSLPYIKNKNSFFSHLDWRGFADSVVVPRLSLFCVLLNNINIKMGKRLCCFIYQMRWAQRAQQERQQTWVFMDLDDYDLTASGLIRMSVRGKFCLLFFPFPLLIQSKNEVKLIILCGTIATVSYF